MSAVCESTESASLRKSAFSQVATRGRVAGHAGHADLASLVSLASLASLAGLASVTGHAGRSGLADLCGLTLTKVIQEDKEETIVVCCHRKFEEFADGKICQLVHCIKFTQFTTVTTML